MNLSNMILIKVQVILFGIIKQRSMNLIRIGKIMLIIASFQMLNLSCSTPEKSNMKLNGKSTEFVIEKLGKPDSTNEFILTKKLYEYQYRLLMCFPEPEGKNILIKEFIWENSHKKTVVWFHKVNDKLESIDNLTWNPNKIKY